MKSSFNGEQAPAACGEDFLTEEQCKEDAKQTQSEGAALGKPEGLPCLGHLLIRRNLLRIQFQRPLLVQFDTVVRSGTEINTGLDQVHQALVGAHRATHSCSDVSQNPVLLCVVTEPGMKMG